MSTRHQYTSWFLLLLSAITLWIFWPLYSGAYTLRDEAADLLIPVFSHIREALLHGEWPWWNKYQNQGIETALSPLYWNPLYLLCGGLFASPANALNAMYLLFILTGGLGFFKLAGLMMDDRRIAVAGGLCYPLAGFFVIQSSYMDLIATGAWLPLLLYAGLKYQAHGRSRHLILLAMGYFLFVTSASPGFVIMTTLVLLAMFFYTSKGDTTHRLLKVAISLFATGFLVWRIYWLRWQNYIDVMDFGSMRSSITGSIQDLSSLLLSKVPVLSTGIPDYTGRGHFSMYIGVIILFMALYSMWQSRTKTDERLGLFGLMMLTLSILSPAIDSGDIGISGMTASAFTASLKILVTGSLLLLGLRGFQKIVTNPKPARIPFLVIALVIAGIALLSGGDTSMISAPIQQDLWKSSLFLLLTGLACRADRANIRLLLIGSLIIADTGISNVLNQHNFLYNSSPSSAFTSQISYPEKRTRKVDLTRPIGKYSDQDFRIATLHRNTGTLVKEIVRDGYWPWKTKLQAETIGSSERQQQLRYPLFYYSKDTTRRATPSYTNFDDPIDIRSQNDHSWQLFIQSKYEKYLVFNQNYDKNWLAYIDDDMVPVVPVSAGMMRIAISPGSHTVDFIYRTDGLMHIFVVTMLVMILLALVLVIKKRFPYSVLIAGWPIIILYIFPPHAPRPTESDQMAQKSREDSTSFEFNYESHAPYWFTRPGQITTEDSYDGYRSESLSPQGEYSATLRIPGQALKDKNELEFSFHIYDTEPAEIAVVLKTYSRNDDSYNIKYITPLNTGQWSTIKGRFSLQGLQGPLVKAEFYIWNHQKKDFLIDDIRVRLHP